MQSSEPMEKRPVSDDSQASLLGAHPSPEFFYTTQKNLLGLDGYSPHIRFALMPPRVTQMLK
jgi:hypothetical protein